MNRTKKRTSLFIAIAMIAILALSACGNEINQPAGSETTPAGSSQVESQPQPASSSSLSGEYKLFATGMDGRYFSADRFSTLAQQMFDGLAEYTDTDESTKEEILKDVDFADNVLTLNEDGTASLVLYGSPMECSWTEKDGIIEFSVTSAEREDESAASVGDLFEATYEPGIVRMTIPSMGYEMIFASEDADTSGIKIINMTDAFNYADSSEN